MHRIFCRVTSHFWVFFSHASSCACVSLYLGKSEIVFCFHGKLYIRGIPYRRNHSIVIGTIGKTDVQVYSWNKMGLSDSLYTLVMSTSIDLLRLVCGHVTHFYISLFFSHLSRLVFLTSYQIMNDWKKETSEYKNNEVFQLCMYVFLNVDILLLYIIVICLR